MFYIAPTSFSATRKEHIDGRLRKAGSKNRIFEPWYPENTEPPKPCFSGEGCFSEKITACKKTKDYLKIMPKKGSKVKPVASPCTPLRGCSRSLLPTPFCAILAAKSSDLLSVDPRYASSVFRFFAQNITQMAQQERS